jgi:hypothetical protein
MTTTGQQAVNLLRATGFRAASSGPLSDGTSYAIMSDIEGRTIGVRIDAVGELMQATPMGSWATDLMRDHGWSQPPFVRTVDGLERLLIGADDTKCDGWCTGLQHRKACPARVVVR